MDFHSKSRDRKNQIQTTKSSGRTTSNFLLYSITYSLRFVVAEENQQYDDVEQRLVSIRTLPHA